VRLAFFHLLYFPVGNSPSHPLALPLVLPPFQPPSMPVADPATRFAPQLQQLRDMGFTDEARNLQVRRCRGVRREGRGERRGEGPEVSDPGV